MDPNSARTILPSTFNPDFRFVPCYLVPHHPVFSQWIGETLNSTSKSTAEVAKAIIEPAQKEELQNTAVASNGAPQGPKKKIRVVLPENLESIFRGISATPLNIEVWQKLFNHLIALSDTEVFQKVWRYKNYFITQTFIAPSELRSLRTKIVRLVFSLLQEKKVGQLREYMQFEYIEGSPEVAMDIIYKFKRMTSVESTPKSLPTEFSINLLLNENRMAEMHDLCSFDSISKGYSRGFSWTFNSFHTAMQLKQSHQEAESLYKESLIRFPKEAAHKCGYSLALYYSSQCAFQQAFEILEKVKAILPSDRAKLNTYLLQRLLAPNLKDSKNLIQKLREELNKILYTSSIDKSEILVFWATTEDVAQAPQYAKTLYDKVHIPDSLGEKTIWNYSAAFLYHLFLNSHFDQTKKTIGEILLKWPKNSTLMALFTMLQHSAEKDAKILESVKKTLEIVPKSGNMWLEAARIHLNPLSRHFDLVEAQKCLINATYFTPQLIDIAFEMERLEQICLSFNLRCPEIIIESKNYLCNLAAVTENIYNFFGINFDLFKITCPENAPIKHVFKEAKKAIEAHCKTYRHLYEAAIAKNEAIIKSNQSAYRELISALGDPLKMIAKGGQIPHTHIKHKMHIIRSFSFNPRIFNF